MTVFYLLAKLHINFIISLTKKIKTTFVASRGMIVVFCSRDYQVLLKSIIFFCVSAALKNFFILQSNLITECSDTQTSSQHYFVVVVIL